MSEQGRSNITKDWFHNELKDFSISDIEKAIAEAITKLVGLEFTCSFKKVEFKTGPLGTASADIELNIEEYREFPEFGSKEKK